MLLSLSLYIYIYSTLSNTKYIEAHHCVCVIIYNQKECPHQGFQSKHLQTILCSQGIHEVVYDKDLEDRQAVAARLNLKSRSSLEAGL